jgi:hypothetical protein
MFNCELQNRECERRAERQHPGTDPCSAYSRCRAKKMCEASRCVCLRTHGSADPALIEEAQAMCYAVFRPHAGNSCNRYIDACGEWSQAQQQKPKPKPDPVPPAHAPGTPQPLRPNQLPR